MPRATLRHQRLQQICTGLQTSRQDPPAQNIQNITDSGRFCRKLRDKVRGMSQQSVIANTPAKSRKGGDSCRSTHWCHGPLGITIDTVRFFSITPRATATQEKPRHTTIPIAVPPTGVQLIDSRDTVGGEKQKSRCLLHRQRLVKICCRRQSELFIHGLSRSFRCLLLLSRQFWIRLRVQLNLATNPADSLCD